MTPRQNTATQPSAARRPAAAKLGLALLAACGLTVLAGCSARDGILRQAYLSNVEAPFPWQRPYPGPPKMVYRHLLATLPDFGTRITARDDAHGFVSWTGDCAPFAVARAGARKADDSLDVSFAAEVVHGSARVRSAGAGAVVSVHCVLRDCGDSSVAPSNGDYERLLLDHLGKRVRP